MIPESFIEQLKTYSDIEQVISSYVNLKRNGRHLKGLCPFHSEKTPSFMVYPESQSFYCFGCGAGGDVVTFIKRTESLEYIEALRFLAQRAGLALPEDAKDDGTALLRTKILEMNREAARFYFAQLTTGNEKTALTYLRNRGLEDKTIKRFGLGYAPDTWGTLKDHLLAKGYTLDQMHKAALIGKSKNDSYYDVFRGRIMFPIIDLRGNVIAFGGRIMGEGGPKYLNSGDTLVFKKSKNLFAMNRAKATKQEQLLLVEGYMDVISVHQAGFDNAIATLGTALTPEQARLIAQYTAQVVIAYDADEAGQNATKRAIKIFDEIGIKVRVLAIPDAKDPDEYIKKFGAGRFKLLIDGSANAMDFEIQKLMNKHDTTIADGKVNFLKDFCYLMAEVTNGIQRDVYIGKIATDLSVSKDAIIEQVRSIIKQKQRSKQKKELRDMRVYSEILPNHARDLQRSKHIKYALAEDKLLLLLMKNPDYFAYISGKIKPEEFVTDFNKGLFTVLYRRLLENKEIDMTSLSSEFDDEQMSRISWLIASAEGLTYSKTEADEYMNTILSFGTIKTAEQIAATSDEELGNYIKMLGANKK